MRIPKSHYSRFLISVQFDRHFMSDSLESKIEQCQDFLYDLGKLAQKNGKRLRSTYSVVRGEIGYHAHFAVSWLPIIKQSVKRAKTDNQTIASYPVIELLENNYFYVDNPKQAIKKITHDQKFVTNYVIYQDKDNQTPLFSAFYKHENLVPSYSEKKIHSYCSKRQFEQIKIYPKNGCINKTIAVLYMMSIGLFVISIILLSLF